MSGSEFRELFDGLVSATDEYAKLIPVLKETVVPALSNAQALLDVGAGPGLLTVPLSADFGEITIVEPDPVYCLQATEKVLTQGKLVTAYNGMWDEVSLGNRFYDLIVRLAVILVANADESKAIVRQALHIEEVGSYPFSNAVVDFLESKDYRFDVLTLEASIAAETPQELLGVLALFPIMQYDTKSTEPERMAMVREHFGAGAFFQMPYDVDLVTVTAAP